VAARNAQEPESLNIIEFVDRAKRVLSPVLGEPGRVLYSSSRTLRRGQYYFLGLNPGGTEKETIEGSLNRLSTYLENAYVDERWKHGSLPPGEHPLQRNARRLFTALGADIKDVCASNLIFSRSVTAAQAGYPRKALICWPVHEMILQIVHPRAILTFGQQPFDFLREKLTANARLRDIPTGRRDGWTCRVARTSSGLILLGLPHLSWFRPSDDVLMRIHECVGVHR
jgi:hypothetical protein